MLTNGERYRKHSLIPLDELLNSSDDYNPTEIQPVLPQKVSRQEFEVCERRVKHLTVLLADAERDIAKLTQLNEILKEDIRRQQRSVEREQHANNFEYLKNVVFKVIYEILFSYLKFFITNFIKQLLYKEMKNN